MKTVQELRDERAKLFAAQEEILQRSDDSLSGEDQTEFDRIEGDLDKVERDITVAEKHEQRARELAAPVTEPIKPAAVGSDDPAERDAAYAAAFTSYLRWGFEQMDPEERKVLQGGRSRDNDRPDFEARTGATPQTVTTTGGGYLIPKGFSNELSEALKAFGGTRQMARVLSTPTGNPIDWPTEDDTASVGELLAINTAAADQAETFGTVQLIAYKYSSKAILVPMELAQDSFFNLDGHIRDVMTTRLGRITNTHYTVGDGSGKPKGIVAEAYSSVTSENATGVTYNDLVNLEHSVDPAYRRYGPSGSKFMFADSTLKVLKKLKDANGNPLWLPSLSSTSPATVLGYEYIINQDMAAATTGLKSVLFGDGDKFVIRDIATPVVLRLVERFAELAQVGYLAFMRTDSRGIQAESNNGAIRYLLQA